MPVESVNDEKLFWEDIYESVLTALIRADPGMNDDSAARRAKFHADRALSERRKME